MGYVPYVDFVGAKGPGVPDGAFAFSYRLQQFHE